MQALLERWEERLAREGLGAIDRGGQVTHGARNHHRDWEDTAAERAAAADEYLTWAKGVLERYDIDARHGNTALGVWCWHVEGLSHNQIAEKLSMRRRTVTAHISAIKLAAGGAPPNPWRKSGKDTSMGNREAQAQQGNQAEGLRGAQGQIRTVYRYERILCRDGNIEIKGRGARHDRLLDVDGRPHAGGIDVVLGPEDLPNIPPQVITIPWWRIKQADRAGE